MSLIDIARAPGRHRVLSIRELHRQIAELQSSRRLLKATAHQHAVEAGTLQRQLDAAGIEISGLLHDLDASETAHAEAREEGSQLRAALANATSTSVPARQRDIEPGDEPTSPTGINVMPLWTALGIVPGNTSPSHVPGL